VNKREIPLLTGIFIISSVTLCLEISLTRYFSISQHYHFAFLVVSISFLGYGASGSLLSLFPRLLEIKPALFLSSTSLLYSLSILICFIFCNILPFDFFKLSWDKNQIFFIFLFYFLLSLPFLFAGLTISFAITSTSWMVNKLYFADLLGAGTGSLLATATFLPRGDRGVMLIISFIVLWASILFRAGRSSRLFILIVALLISFEVTLFLISPPFLSFRISPYKSLPLALKYPQARLLFTKWNSISRIDIIESGAIRFAPGLSLIYEKSLPHQLGLSVDGGELTAITNVKNLDEQSLEFLSFLPSSLAYHFVKNPDVLIIEPKGSLDVLAAHFFKANSIKVIESNPLIKYIVQNELASFSGHIYEKENISIISTQSRVALKNEKKKYDLIVFPLSDVFGSSHTGLYGFGENYLYTLDSFATILDLLSPRGLISMTLYLLPPPRQELRLLATWIEALEGKNKNPASHLIAIRSWGTISYFIKNSPFSTADIKALKEFSKKCLFDLIFYEGIKEDEVNLYNRFDKPLYYNYTLKLLSSSERENFLSAYLFKISPVTDNRPFFYNFFKPEKLKATYDAFGQKLLPFLQGEFLVPLLFFQALLIAFILILMPHLLKKRNRIIMNKNLFFSVLLYFGLIGMSFMFVEIILIQKFILFLGHPLYSISVILSSLLISSGIGSLFSRRFLIQEDNLKIRLRLSLCATTLIIILYLYFLPLIFRHLISANFSLKVFLTFFFILPLGFMMGFPFPTGIRLLEKQNKKLIPWAWAINAFSSVINSVAALLIAFFTGYMFVLSLAAAGYLISSSFLNFSNHRNKTHA